MYFCEDVLCEEVVECEEDDDVADLAEDVAVSAAVESEYWFVF